MKEDSHWCEEERCMCHSSSSSQRHMENANPAILMPSGNEMYKGAVKEMGHSINECELQPRRLQSLIIPLALQHRVTLLNEYTLRWQKTPIKRGLFILLGSCCCLVREMWAEMFILLTALAEANGFTYDSYRLGSDPTRCWAPSVLYEIKSKPNWDRCPGEETRERGAKSNSPLLTYAWQG